MKTATMVIVLLCGTAWAARPAGPATAPATTQASLEQRIADAKATVGAASAKLAEAQAACDSELRASKSYADAIVALNAASVARDKIRATGTPQQKLDAGHDFGAANEAVKKMMKGVDADPRMIAARAAMNEASAAYSGLLDERKRQLAAAAEEAIQRDPVRRGERDGKVTKGMSVAQVTKILGAPDRSGTNSDGAMRCVWDEYELVPAKFHYADGTEENSPTVKDKKLKWHRIVYFRGGVADRFEEEAIKN